MTDTKPDPKKDLRKGLKKGIVLDAWRTPPLPTAEAAPPLLAPSVNLPDAPTRAGDAGDDIDVDDNARNIATLTVKNYGGITVTGAPSTSHVAAQVLRFLVDNLREADKIITEYGIVVTKLRGTDAITGTPFYVQRQDGWTLAIPAVPTRDAGCVQLIQALLHLQRMPHLKARMDSLGIRVYRI